MAALGMHRNDWGRGISRRLDIPATCGLIVTMLCWGIAPVMLRFFAIRDILPDGYTSNMIRYPIGVLLYLPLLIAVVRRRRIGRLWMLALIPAVANVFAQTLWAAAPYYLDIPRVGFLIRISVVFSIVGAFCMFPDERRLLRSKVFWTGAVLSVLGFIVMASASSTAADPAGSAHAVRPVAGIVILLACAVFHAVYGLSVRAVMKDESPLLMFALVGLYTAVALAMLGPMGEPSRMCEVSGWNWFLVVISSIIGVSAGHGFYYFSVQRIGVAVTTLALSATPFVTALAAWVWFGEGLNSWQFGGGLLLAFGSVLAARSQNEIIPEAEEHLAEEQCAQP